MASNERELYQKEEYCMVFSTEDIQTEYIEKLKQFVDSQIQVDGDGPDGTIDYITFECGANTFEIGRASGRERVCQYV